MWKTSYLKYYEIEKFLNDNKIEEFNFLFTKTSDIDKFGEDIIWCCIAYKI